MATPIKIPDIGTTLDTVILHRWLAAEGDRIARGQAIVEVEADKALMTLESAAAGVLLKTVAQPGAEVSIGGVIAFVGDPGEAAPEVAEAGSERQAPAAPPPASPPRTVSRPRVSTVLRNLARQKGVDLDQVAGTGPDGAIVREDILAAAQRQAPGR